MDQKHKDKIADILWYIKGQIDLKRMEQDYSGPFDDSHLDVLLEAMNTSPKIVIVDEHIASRYWIQGFVKDFEHLKDIAIRKGSVYVVSGIIRCSYIKSAAFVCNYQYARLERMFKENKLIELKKK